jgi:hypothetical protein
MHTVGRGLVLTPAQYNEQELAPRVPSSIRNKVRQASSTNNPAAGQCIQSAVDWSIVAFSCSSMPRVTAS